MPYFYCLFEGKLGYSEFLVLFKKRVENEKQEDSKRLGRRGRKKRHITPPSVQAELQCIRSTFFNFTSNR